MERPVNPLMIVLARDLEEWTQGKLAKELKISQGKLSKIEAGILPVPADLLARMARVLDRPESFFRQDERLYAIDTSLLYHRKRETAPAGALRWIHAGANIRRIHVRRFF